MVNEFTREPVANVPKSNFSELKSHQKTTTSSFFKLIPTLTEWLVPGDSIGLNLSCFGRAISLEAPILNKIRIRHDLFFVSANSMDREFKHFLPRVSPDSSSSSEPNDIKFPTLSQVLDDDDDTILFEFARAGELSDRMGLHFYKYVYNTSDLTQSDYDNFSIHTQISSYPYVAYQRICDKYFTNYDLQDNKFLDLDIRDFENVTASDIMKVRYSNWNYDYFTSALPWIQRFASPEIDLTKAFVSNWTGNPLALNKQIGGIDGQIETFATGAFPGDDGYVRVNSTTGQNTASLKIDDGYSISSGLLKVTGLAHSSGDIFAQGMNDLGISADVTGISVTMADLRTSMLLQLFLEAQARGGSRYDEMSLTMYGIAPSNEVLHEPLWLGGFTQNLMTSEVVSTSSNSDNGSYLGNLAGHGITSETNNLVSDFTAKEFGVLMCITQVYPEQIYSQGVKRDFIYTDYFGSIFNPMFNNMSNQPVWNQEIFNDGHKIDIDSDTDVFGYNGIYDFMRVSQNDVDSDLRSDTLLGYWLATRNFSIQPQLNASFINGKNSVNDLNKIFSITNHDTFILSLDFNYTKFFRPVPSVAIPAFTSI